MKPFSWSYSSLQKFNNCPKRYYEERVVKRVVQKPTEQSLWGDRVHKAFEQELHKPAPGATLPEEMKDFEPVVKRLGHIRGKLHTEQQLAITYSFQPTAWFAPDVWCRGILDALWIDGENAKVVDHKTGKRKRDSNQLKLFALLTFAHHPEIERVNTAYLWLQTGAMDVEKYKREDLHVLWQDLLPDVRRMETAHRNNTFPPKPGPLCSFCPVDSCSFWKAYDGNPSRARTK